MALPDTLRNRLLLLFAMTLLLPGVYGIIEAARHFLDQQRLAYASLTGYATRAANDEANMVDEASRLVASLSHERDLIKAVDSEDARQTCNGLLEKEIKSNPAYRNVTVFDLGGKPICGAAAPLMISNVADQPWFQDALRRQGPALSTHLTSGDTNEPALIVGSPMTDTDDRMRAVLALVVRLAWLKPRERLPGFSSNDAIYLLDRSGQAAVDASAGDQRENHALPAGELVQAVVNGDLQNFTAVGRDGIERIYVAFQVGRYNLYMLLGQSREEVLAPFWQELVMHILLLAFILAATIAAAAVGTRLLITRWLDQIAYTALEITQGRIPASNRMHHAPIEFRQFGATLKEMAQRVDERQLQLRSSVESQQQTLRELHHRVKNNLQIVISYLNLYARQPRNASIRVEIEDLQIRINAMALAQRYIYDGNNWEEISLAPLLENLCSLIGGPATSSPLTRLHLEISEVMLGTDRVVPFVLLASELLAVPLRSKENGYGAGELTVMLAQSDEEQATLELVYKNGKTLGQVPEIGMSQLLINALVKQLNGELAAQRDGTTRTVLKFQTHWRVGEKAEVSQANSDTSGQESLRVLASAALMSPLTGNQR